MKSSASEESQYKLSYQAVGVCLAANIPVILWGDPGQGKSQVITRFSELLGMHLETILASIREPQDFIGLPALQGNAMGYYPPAWAQQIKEAKSTGVVFFDEVSTAPPSVQAALLRVCLDKVVGELTLPEETRIIAAANPPGIAADGWDLAAPLANRFCHIYWSLPTAIVSKGFKGSWPHFDIPLIDSATFEQDVNEELALIGDFLLRSDTPKTRMTTLVPTTVEGQGQAFPTPRSWEMAAKASATVTHLNLEENLRQLLLFGCVGETAGKQYFTYRNETDLPDPEKIIEDPLMELDLRPDIAHRTGHSVLRAYDSNPSEERWKQVSKFIVRLFDDGKPDVAYSLTRHFTKKRTNWAIVPELARRIADFTKR